jgi:O-methyltransferase involved in polyketide biosynthesis
MPTYRSPFLRAAFLLVGVCCEGSAFVSSHSLSPSARHVTDNPLSLIKGQNAMERQISNLDRNDTNNRGDRYGSINSTIPPAQIAALAVGVVPPLEAPAKVWKRAWTLHRRAMPILHFFDSTKPPDSSLALMCLWWKALSANDEQSPAFDNSLVYDLLPRATRVLVGKKLRRFYPRLHHANVELRTAYLDQQVTAIIDQMKTTPTKAIRLVTLGAGYDVRSMKFRERGLVDQAVELDLPNVVEAKRAIFSSKRLKHRRPSLTESMLPTFHSINLNDVDQVKEILMGILGSDDDANKLWHTIFLFEGVMIYLDEGVPRRLLETCSAVLKEAGKEGSLVFADRLDNIPGGDYEIGVKELALSGWKVVDWQPKPGLARHMGRAELIMEL